MTIDARAITPAAGGTCSTTGASSATCARATAGCTTASAAPASCASASATRWCSPPTAARRASASTRSRRSRSTTSIPGSSVLSFGTAGCNLACKFCQNWDISKSRDMDRLMDAGLAGGDRARGRSAQRLHERRLHLQRPGDLRRVRDGHRRRLPRARHQDRRRHRRLHARRSRGASSTPRWTPPTST